MTIFLSQPTGDGIYDTGYARLLTLLREAGCTFAGEEETTTKTSTSPGAGVYGSVYAGLLSEFPEGSRKVLDTSKGAVIVTNQQGVLYAINAKCPHLGLPMKTGEITTIKGDSAAAATAAAVTTPILTCKFHNSQFRLDNGQCVSWCTGVMGIPGTEMVTQLCLFLLIILQASTIILMIKTPYLPSLAVHQLTGCTINSQPTNYCPYTH